MVYDPPKVAKKGIGVQGYIAGPMGVRRVCACLAIGSWGGCIAPYEICVVAKLAGKVLVRRNPKTMSFEALKLL